MLLTFTLAFSAFWNRACTDTSRRQVLLNCGKRVPNVETAGFVSNHPGGFIQAKAPEIATILTARLESDTPQTRTTATGVTIGNAIVEPCHRLA